MKRRYKYILIGLLLISLMVFIESYIRKLEKADDSTFKVSYVTGRDKKKWQDKAEDLVHKMSLEGAFNDECGINVALALFDFDLDGTPELINFYDGGSSGTLFGQICDLNDGKEKGFVTIGSFKGYDYDSSLCVYLNTENEEYRVINWGSQQMGLSYQMRFVEDIVWNDSKKAFEDNNLFFFEYITDCADIEVNFYVEKAAVDESVYNDKMEAFHDENLRLSKTGVRLIFWREVEENDEKDIDKMVELLLNTEQEFIKK